VCGTGHEVVRVEQVAETLASQARSPTGLLDEFRAELRERAAGAVALKTVVAYRSGLDVPAECPPDRDASLAAERWLRSGDARLTDPALHAWVVHEAARIGAELGLPLQFHTGFGDDDLHLREVDPLLLTDFLRSTRDNGVAVVLLHCWPFHRNAAYLAHVFDHVSVDIGLTLPHVGVRAGDVLAETLELAPFDSVLYSSDGNVLPELHHLGAALWRHHFGRLLDGWLADDVLDVDDAERLAFGVGAENAARLHPRLGRADKS
jgi:predicted TIM-barrel fold metal-dependent hydrolase